MIECVWMYLGFKHEVIYNFMSLMISSGIIIISSLDIFVELIIPLFSNEIIERHKIVCVELEIVLHYSFSEYTLDIGYGQSRPTNINKTLRARRIVKHSIWSIDLPGELGQIQHVYHGNLSCWFREKLKYS